jgi:hypothetical protein
MSMEKKGGHISHDDDFDFLDDRVYRGTASPARHAAFPEEVGYGSGGVGVVKASAPSPSTKTSLGRSLQRSSTFGYGLGAIVDSGLPDTLPPLNRTASASSALNTYGAGSSSASPSLLSSSPQLPSLEEHITVERRPAHYEPHSSLISRESVPTILQAFVAALQEFERCYFTYCPESHSISGIVYIKHNSATWVFQVYDECESGSSKQKYLCQLKRMDGCAIAFRQFYGSVTQACQVVFEQEQDKEQSFFGETHTTSKWVPTTPFSSLPGPPPPPLDDEDDDDLLSLTEGYCDTLASAISSPYCDTQAEAMKAYINLITSNPSMGSHLLKAIPVLSFLSSSSSPLLSPENEVQHASVMLLSTLIHNNSNSLQAELVNPLVHILCEILEQPLETIDTIDARICAASCLKSVLADPSLNSCIKKEQLKRCGDKLQTMSYYCKETKPCPPSTMSPLVLTR